MSWATLKKHSKNAIVPRQSTNILTDNIDFHQKADTVEARHKLPLQYVFANASCFDTVVIYISPKDQTLTYLKF